MRLWLKLPAGKSANWLGTRAARPSCTAHLRMGRSLTTLMTDRTSIEDYPREWRPKTTTSEDNIEKIQNIIIDKRIKYTTQLTRRTQFEKALCKNINKWGIYSLSNICAIAKRIQLILVSNLLWWMKRSITTFSQIKITVHVGDIFRRLCTQECKDNFIGSKTYG